MEADIYGNMEAEWCYVDVGEFIMCVSSHVRHQSFLMILWNLLIKAYETLTSL